MPELECSPAWSPGGVLASSDYVLQDFKYSTLQSGKGGIGGARGGDIASYNTTANHFYVSTENEEKAIGFLYEHGALGAFHNSAERYDAPKCHPQTREAVIKEIIDWTETDTKEHPVLWMYGPAGTGKSSIAQTIANLLHKEGKVAGSFFFSRTAANRNTSTRLITSIAYQLTVTFPNIRKHVAEAIDSDRAIFSRSLEAQLDSLVIQPLRKLSDKGGLENTSSSLIIVDGLDECGEPESQRHVLTVLFSVFQKAPYPPLCILIACRPEDIIQMFFDQDGEQSLSRRLDLDAKYQADDDIRTFLHSRFDDIRKNHPARGSLPSDWPSGSDVNELVQKASGQFIYASTVMKFVESRNELPQDSLEIILNLRPAGNKTPFVDLDALYTHILSSVADLKRVMDTLIFLIFTRAPSTIYSVETWFSWRAGEMRIILKDLHSVIYVPPQGDDDSSDLHLFHASFGDFLQEKARSKDFFIDDGEAYSVLARRGMKHVAEAVASRPNFPNEISDGPQHELLFNCCFFWCKQSKLTDDLLEELSRFDFCEFLNACFPNIERLYPALYWGCEFITHLITYQDGTLGRKYFRDFDRFLQCKMAVYPSDLDPHHLFTAFTLKAVYSDQRGNDVIMLLTGAQRRRAEIKGPDLLESDKRGCQLGSMGPFIPDYYRMVSEFLLDAERSGIYHVTNSRFRDLAQFCVEFLVNPWPVNIRDPDDLVVNMLLGIFERISEDPNPELAKYLIDNPIRRNLARISSDKRAKLLTRIRLYVEDSQWTTLLDESPASVDNHTEDNQTSSIIDWFGRLFRSWW